MVDLTIPARIPNFVAGKETPPARETWFPKFDPATGRVVAEVARSQRDDVTAAVCAAQRAQPGWASTTVVRRGETLRALTLELQAHQMEMARIVAAETGKSLKDAMAECVGAIEMGFFVASEGRRYYGRTTTSAIEHRVAMTVRQPLGVAGLIIAANTPLANVAWKVFPALLCGNAVVLKPAEDTPLSAWAFARLAAAAAVPAGVLNVVHGYGDEAGAPLVECPDVAVVSFTGSCEVGRTIARVASGRLAKVCLELGGKNPLVVCDDADLERAVEAAALSGFSNAGQRCAAGSRVIVFDRVYEEFRERLVQRVGRLRVGTANGDDFGPVINEMQLNGMLAAIEAAKTRGIRVLTGGHRLSGPGYDGGYFLAPTILEGAGPDDAVSQTELFGPIIALYRVRTLDDAVQLANQSPFGLTAAVWTRSIHRAMVFMERVQAGVVSVNGPTYGSEPHLPFGGLKASGNGLREAGTEALDVYSDWKTIYLNHDPQAL
ncbi:MAG TPA: aldehyde dehydrogenase family protein [Gemmatimonadaceae bacterium]|nr:aldehyde dehydrogenase family protein [Gemmatimonadaceae bacterium]